MKKLFAISILLAWATAHAFIFFGGTSGTVNAYHADNLDNGTATNVFIVGGTVSGMRSAATGTTNVSDSGEFWYPPANYVLENQRGYTYKLTESEAAGGGGFFSTYLNYPIGAHLADANNLYYPDGFTAALYSFGGQNVLLSPNGRRISDAAGHLYYPNKPGDNGSHVMVSSNGIFAYTGSLSISNDGAFYGNGKGLTNLTITAVTNAALAQLSLNDAGNLTNLFTLLRPTTNFFGQTNTTSFILTNSPLEFTITPGTWFIDAYVECKTLSATSGLFFELPVQGSDLVVGAYNRFQGTMVNSGGNNLTVASTYSAAELISLIVDASQNVGNCFSMSAVMVVSTQTNIYRPRLYQRTANDLVNRPFITTNSFIRIRKL